MRGKPWRNQIADGRVFELRSASRRYQPPCALVISAGAGYGCREVVGVDKDGVIGNGIYRRDSNPAIYVEGLRGKRLTERIVRRRRDLERFDYYDLELIRYGHALDFDGRIHGSCGDTHIPLVAPAEWTVFWLPAFAPSDFFWPSPDIAALMRGAWWFSNHGGPRHLGYKYGRMWATRHSGRRLDAIRSRLRVLRGDMIEQRVRVARWSDNEHTYTAEIRRECPALGGRAISVDTTGTLLWRAE
jgi:hypothetical protein